MNCETVSERLPELLAGALGVEAEQETLTHLARCPRCRGELAFWAQMQQAVQGAAQDAPEEIIVGVREGLFGPRAVTVIQSFRVAGRALGLAGSACRLALAATGFKI